MEHVTREGDSVHIAKVAFGGMLETGLVRPCNLRKLYLAIVLRSLEPWRPSFMLTM